MKSNHDYVRERAELAGLTLSSNDIDVIKRKWENTPLCNLDDLLSGIRQLREMYYTRAGIAEYIGED